VRRLRLHRRSCRFSRRAKSSRNGWTGEGSKLYLQS
jgi:hypothetical protein